MRVLYFTGAYRPDSMVSHTHGDLVAALRTRGADVEIATIAGGGQATVVEPSADRHGTTVWSLAVPQSLPNRLMRQYYARAWAFAPFGGVVRALGAFLTADRLAQYDILHIGMAFPYATAFRHALRSHQQPPTLVTITGGDILTDDASGYGYGRSPVTRAAIRRTLNWATLVQANSPRSAAVVAEYGSPADRIAVQPPQSAHEPLAISAVAAYRARCRQDLIASGAIPAGRLLVSIGRMVPIKAYDDVIRALPAIRTEHPDTTLLLAGPARDAAAEEYRASLRTLAASLGQEDHVRIIGALPFEDVPRYFAAADLALIPSVLDGLNMTAVEAASVGTPSVVSENAGIAHYVRAFGAGAVVPPRDPAALATEISRLLAAQATWADASRHATEMAASFSLERTADGVLGLYERLGSH